MAATADNELTRAQGVHTKRAEWWGPEMSKEPKGILMTYSQFPSIPGLVHDLRSNLRSLLSLT